MMQINKNPSGKKMGKQELQQELEEIQNTLKNQEKKFEACEEELQNAKKELNRLEEIQAKLNSTEEQLKKLEKIEERNKTLEVRMEKAEKKASDQVEKLGKKLQASEGKRTELQDKIKHLESNVDSLTDQLEAEQQYEKAISEAIPTSSASFRIDIYPYQGHYQGKIEHLLSKDRRAFKNLDEKAIKDFISRHLPSLDENHKEAATGISSGAFTLVTDDMEMSESEPMSAQMPELSEIKIIKPDAYEPCGILNKNESFNIVADLALEGVEK